MAFPRKRCFMGTSSPMTNGKESWVEAPRPIKVSPPINAGILCAVPLTMAPMRATTAPEMKNQRRPKMSERRPTNIRPTPSVRLYTRATQT